MTGGPCLVCGRAFVRGEPFRCAPDPEPGAHEDAPQGYIGVHLRCLKSGPPWPGGWRVQPWPGDGA